MLCLYRDTPAGRPITRGLRTGSYGVEVDEVVVGAVLEVVLGGAVVVVVDDGVSRVVVVVDGAVVGDGAVVVVDDGALLGGVPSGAGSLNGTAARDPPSTYTGVPLATVS